MLRVFSFLLGFIFMTIGFFYIILYINLISFGYSLGEYFSYLVSRYECWNFIVGLLIIVITLWKEGNKNDKRL
jgi:hypothetical protein